jgi:hypothetical protein
VPCYCSFRFSASIFRDRNGPQSVIGHTFKGGISGGRFSYQDEATKFIIIAGLYAADCPTLIRTQTPNICMAATPFRRDLYAGDEGAAAVSTSTVRIEIVVPLLLRTIWKVRNCWGKSLNDGPRLPISRVHNQGHRVQHWD